MIDIQFPFEATLTVNRCFDKGDGNRSFDAVSDKGTIVKVWKPDQGDITHLPLITAGDRIKVNVLGPANKPGEFKSHLLPRGEQPKGSQNKWKRLEAGQYGPTTEVEAELPADDHACLKFAWKLERRKRPALTQQQYVTELLRAQLSVIRPLWLASDKD